MAGNPHFNGFSLDENDNDQLEDCLSSLPLEHNSFLGNVDILAGTQIPNPNTNLNPVLRPHSDSQLYPRRATAYEPTRSYHSGPTTFYNHSTDFNTNGYDQRETSARSSIPESNFQFEFPAVNSLQQNPRNLVYPSIDLARGINKTFPIEPAPEYQFPLSPRKRPRPQEEIDWSMRGVESQEAGPDLKYTVGEISHEDKTRAIDFIRGWLKGYAGEDLPGPSDINALAHLTRLPVAEVRRLLVQMMSQVPENSTVTTALSSKDRAAVNTTENSFRSSNLDGAILWAKSRLLCTPTEDVHLLSRHQVNSYQCTFSCGKSFKRKGEWQRHETTNNYPQEAWLCGLDAVTTIGRVLTCSYCSLANPPMSHSLAVHGRTTLCHNKPVKERVYFRKDKFRQHCDKSHPSIDTTDYVERAHFRVNCDVPSYCGFCRETKNFTAHQNRFDHIASHFEGGQDMTQWNQPLPQAFEDEEDDDNDNDYQDGSSNDEDSDYDDGDKDVNEPRDISYGGGNDNQGNYRNSSGHNNGKPSFQDGPSDYGYNSKDSAQFSAHNTASRLRFEHISGLNSNAGWPKSIAQSEHTVNEMVKPARESPGRQLDLPNTNDTHFFAGSKNLAPKRSSLKTVMRDYFRRTKKRPSTIEGVITKTAHRRQNSQTSTNLQNVTDGPLPKASSPEVSNITFMKNNKSSPLIRTQKMDSLSLWTTKDHQSSSVASSATLAAVPLEQEILNALIPQPGHRFFFPESCLDALITEEAIERELLQALPSYHFKNPSLPSWIARTSRRLFAILVYLRKENLIQKFADEEITDSNLPFNLALDFLKGEIRGTLSKVFAGWPRHDIIEFYHIQWSFSAPMFDKLHKHYEMDEHVIMPFLESEEDNARQGGYSEVWRVRIHPAHQRLLQPINGEQPSFAVKRLSSNNPIQFEREVEMLYAFSDRQHTHLVQLLATYKLRERYHLIFPYAKSNLREFWNSFPLVDNPKMTASWALDQMRGIASGLSQIHIYGPRTSEWNNISSSSLPSINLNIRERRFGRHGDIKPENILRFEKEGISGGVLVLSDMGLSQFHGIESRSNVGPQTIGGTRTYGPPEVELGGAVSRAFDIWSLGCVFLEFITWLLDGAQGLDAFADLRIEETADGISDDSFYTIIQKPPPRAIIRKGVREWTEHLRGQPQCSKFLLDTLDLILGSLLTTEPKARISSDELDRKLSKILQRVQTEPHYSEHFNKPKRLSLPSSGGRRIPSILNTEILGEGSELKKKTWYRSHQGFQNDESRGESDPAPPKCFSKQYSSSPSILINEGAAKEDDLRREIHSKDEQTQEQPTRSREGPQHSDEQQEGPSQGEYSNEEEEGASQVDDPDNSQDRNQDNGSNKTSRRSPLSASSGIAAKGDLPSPSTDSTTSKPKKNITISDDRSVGNEYEVTRRDLVVLVS